jgi:hypothetical protein
MALQQPVEHLDTISQNAAVDEHAPGEPDLSRPHAAEQERHSWAQPEFEAEAEKAA